MWTFEGGQTERDTFHVAVWMPEVEVEAQVLEGRLLDQLGWNEHLTIRHGEVFELRGIGKAFKELADGAFGVRVVDVDSKMIQIRARDAGKRNNHFRGHIIQTGSTKVG